MDFQKVKRFRKELHAHPEVSGQEYETARRVAAFIKECKPDSIIEGIGGTGIVATWESEKEGPCLLLRAELDALPIQEINDFPHKSKNKRVSHKCGHDGHTAILCALAQHLAQEPPVCGKVHLLFQPAEEDGEGAAAMFKDDKFTMKPDYVYALHNIPGYPLHTVIVKEGSFSAAVNSIIIDLKGKTSHAAEPENGLNPAMAVSKIIQESLALGLNNPQREDMRIITPVYINLGEKAYGTSAGEASVHLTLRCWDNDNLRRLEKDIVNLTEKIVREEGLELVVSYTQTFYANINDKLSVDIVRNAARKNNFEIEERTYPFKWGEDFGLFTSQHKGCMFGVGAGVDCPALHNPDYDFPEELIETGCQLFINIMRQIHQKHV